MKLKKVINHGKTVWMADLGVWGGRRERLFRSSKAEAQKLISDRQAQRRREGERVFNLSNQEVARLEAAKILAERHGFTVQECVEIAIASGKSLETMSLFTAVTECVAAKRQAGKRPTYIRKFNSHLNTFKASVENCQCHKITRAQIEAWAWKAKDGKVKPVSARSRITDLGTFFSFCLKRKWVLKNPVDDIEPITPEDKPPGIHTLDQVQAVLKCALDNYRAAIGVLACCYFGGLRPDESISLRKENVHDGFIEVESHKSKTRKRRFIPINDTLKAWLAVDGATIGCSKRARDVDNLKWILNGSKTKLNAKGHTVKILKGDFPWPHDVLRHSFCSYGIPKFGATKIAEWAGHSEQILFAHYRERVKPEDAERYWMIRP